MADDFDYEAWESRRPDNPDSIRRWMNELPPLERSWAENMPVTPPPAPEPAAAPDLAWTTQQIKEYTDNNFVTKTSLDGWIKAIAKVEKANADDLENNVLIPQSNKIKALRDQVAKLTEKLDALTDTKEHFRYRGVWKDGEEYEVGNFVTRDGGMWHCNEALTKDKPGEGTGAWKLAVMRGRDAKAIADEKKARGYVRPPED